MSNLKAKVALQHYEQLRRKRDNFLTERIEYTKDFIKDIERKKVMKRRSKIFTMATLR